MKYILNKPKDLTKNTKINTINMYNFRYLSTCKECPKKYPWLGDSKGTGVAGADVYSPENLK